MLTSALERAPTWNASQSTLGWTAVPRPLLVIARWRLTGDCTALCRCWTTSVGTLGKRCTVLMSAIPPRSAAGVITGRRCPCRGGRIAVGTWTVGWCWIAMWTARSACFSGSLPGSGHTRLLMRRAVCCARVQQSTCS